MASFLRREGEGAGEGGAAARGWETEPHVRPAGPVPSRHCSPRLGPPTGHHEVGPPALRPHPAQRPCPPSEGKILGTEKGHTGNGTRAAESREQVRSHTHVHTCAHTHATAHEGQPAPLADQDNDPAPAVRGTPPQGPAPNSCPRGDQGWARGRQAPALPERLGRGSAGPGVRSGGTGVTVTWAGAFQGTPPTLGSSGTRGSFSSRALDEGEGSSEGPAATCGQAWGRCAGHGERPWCTPGSRATRHPGHRRVHTATLTDASMCSGAHGWCPDGWTTQAQAPVCTRGPPPTTHGTHRAAAQHGRPWSHVPSDQRGPKAL